MTIHLPARTEELTAAGGLTPRQIVEQLDRYVVGQHRAKRAVAVALRNRIRRQALPAEMAAEVTPKNILMIGPTGVGKTEIARRLAHLAGSPFVKVEASKFTEVGYVGRDVESMVRDLVSVAIEMVRREKQEEVRDKARANVEEQLLDLLLPPPRPTEAPEGGDEPRPKETFVSTREKLRDQLRSGALDQRQVEVEMRDRQSPSFQIMSSQGVEEMDVNLKDMLPGLFGGRTRRRRLPVPEARDVLQKEEEARLVDADEVSRLAVSRVENAGIIFIDEMDKIAGREGGHGPDVSREGVQRDILPIVEGTTVTTKHGNVKTDHVLFIAAGAFHVSKPSDLIPELQGRFPIRVELEPLTFDDLVRILREPKGALLAQYTALLGTEGVALEFTDDAIAEMARLAMQVNDQTENIGARRLATILETVLEEVSFEGGTDGPRVVRIDAPEVRRRLEGLVKDQDLSRFIL
ncbi:MAG: ATP-dependent protease ATPase subunit HslU [Vicinamibacteria bacterium]